MGLPEKRRGDRVGVGEPPSSGVELRWDERVGPREGVFAEEPVGVGEGGPVRVDRRLPLPEWVPRVEGEGRGLGLEVRVRGVSEERGEGVGSTQGVGVGEKRGVRVGKAKESVD